MYEIINQELQIEACNIGDLTLDNIQSFLRLWGDGSAIETLTLFLKENGTIVLNKDNPLYETYKDMCIKYLQGTEEYRERMKERAPEGFKETINTLESAVKTRNTQELFRILSYNVSAPRGISFGTLQKIFDDYESSVIAIFKILNLGIIEGKRQERARRKRTV